MAKKILTGKVVSDKVNKTRKVVIERRLIHPKYKKVIVRKTKLLVHDPNNISKVGDIVQIIESRPVSKLKHHWIIGVDKKSDNGDKQE